MDKNPWKTLDSREIYDNPWIRVDEHQVIDPSGKPGIYGTVHFKNLALGILALDSDMCLWLVGQYRYPLRCYSWEIPEGGGPMDVAPLDSAKRELKEETGLSAARWDLLAALTLSNAVTDERALVYVARDLEQGPAMPESCEELAVRRVPFPTALEMVLSGEIQDAISVAAILRLKLALDLGTFTVL